jgi:hypothetical protein
MIIIKDIEDYTTVGLCKKNIFHLPLSFNGHCNLLFSLRIIRKRYTPSVGKI